MTTFVDRVVLHVAAGSGGHGCVSVRREKFKPLGGPDGGNGGNGGEVRLVVDASTTTLLDYHRSPHRKAGNGRPGMGDLRNGAGGDDLVLPVPDGTVVTDRGRRPCWPTWSVTAPPPSSPRAVAAGSATRPSRRRAARRPASPCSASRARCATWSWSSRPSRTSGSSGSPAPGKSSLVAAMSAARPKIADYPFTTLVPNLGVVEAGDVRFTMADVPGLIEGASEGRGLGLQFLRHVERCAALVHVLDCATLEPGRDPVSDLDVIEAELAAYGGLDDRPRLVVLNKIDVPQARELAELVRPDLEARGLAVHEVSAATREGLRELGFALAAVVARAARAGAGRSRRAGRCCARGPSTKPASR